jgi:transposase
VIEAVERVAIGTFDVNERGTGSAQYHPRMMLALLIYCYANGIFSSRRIERATFRDIGVRLVAANQHPDHDTIATFRRRNFEAVAASFLQVLLLAKELKLVKVGVVSVDGSKVDAKASKHRSVTYARAGELVEQLKLEIADLLARAEQADGSGEDAPQVLPEEIGRLTALRAKLDAARQRLEAQARARAEVERAAFEAKVRAREERNGRAKGKHPKPPDDTPQPQEQSNLSDPDSRLMRRSKHHEYRQAYNAQAVVDAEGSQLILAGRVSQCASDRAELVADIEAIPAALGKPELVLADNGYANGEEVERLAARGIEALVATGAGGGRRRHDFRPAKAATAAKEPKAEWLQAMATKLASEEGSALYKRRQQTVEPVFGIIKAVLGFTHFSLRGQGKVAGEWSLVALAYNCKRLHKLQLELAS